MSGYSLANLSYLFHSFTLAMTTPTRFILALATLLTAGACSKPQEDLSALEGELMEATAKLGKERKIISGLRDELTKTVDRGEMDQKAVSVMRKETESLLAEMQALTDQFMDYRNAYRDSIRIRAPGMALDDFEAMGRKFTKVIVKTVDDWEIAFRHSGGMVRLDLADAPAQVRILFAYNPQVGPKPAPVVDTAAIAVASSPEKVEVLSSTLGGSSGSGPTDDPFSQPQRFTSVGTALGEDPAAYARRRAEQAASRPVNGGSKTRIIHLRDGSAVEVLADWGN